MPGTKPSCRITADMKRIVGENSDQFIAEVGSWIRTLLPLKCWRWNDMDSKKKERLFNKIKVEWNLPEGDFVKQAVETQCQSLYRHWRYRLKEVHFYSFTIAQAIKNCPEDVDKEDWKWLVRRYSGSEIQKRISEKNRANRLKQKVKDEKNAVRNSSQNAQDGTQASQDGTAGSTEVPSLPPPEPEYIQLWEMTKRRKDNTFDKVAEQRLQEFKELHREQMELHGVDNLTVQEAYLRVLGTSSGYINGLGFGPKPPKRNKEGISDGGGMEIANQMALQLEQMDKNLKEREAKLKGEIERLQKDAKEKEARMKALEEKIAALCAANIR